MAPDIFSKLDALAPTAKALNEECNAVPGLFQRVEERLRQLGLGIPAEVCFSSKRTTCLRGQGTEEAVVPAVATKWLSYEKVNGAWRLCAWERTGTESGVSSYSGEKEFEDIVEEDGPTDLSSLPRSEKVEALEVLPRLIDEIERLAKEHIEIVRKVKESVQSDAAPVPNTTATKPVAKAPDKAPTPKK